jgi:hypothetical protein
MSETAIRACLLLAPLRKLGIDFEPAGQCVRFEGWHERAVPYILAENIIAAKDPCRFVRLTLAGRQA